MCGRFSIAGFEGFEERFQLKIEFPDLKHNYNVAPSQDVPVILNRGSRWVYLLSGAVRRLTKGFTYNGIVFYWQMNLPLW